MFKFNSKLMAATAFSAVLLAGCSGGGSDNNGGDSNGGGFEMATPLVGKGENMEPIDINSLTLAADDTSEPAPVN